LIETPFELEATRQSLGSDKDWHSPLRRKWLALAKPSPICGVHFQKADRRPAHRGVGKERLSILRKAAVFAAMIGTFTDGLPEPLVHQAA
jgi:hypothetical protein